MVSSVSNNSSLGSVSDILRQQSQQDEARRIQEQERLAKQASQQEDKRAERIESDERRGNNVNVRV